ncbi:DUF2834 domain-containing protein [Nocardia sp. GCM10030253]|uniref:DUF2834 domain-containing protein n=1 Tax=Nocardia sp. GCM10030253 TaxID=3273404 RepID=UPI0036417A23
MSDLHAESPHNAGWRTPLRLFLAAMSVIGFVVPNAMVITYLSGSDHTQVDYFRAWTASLPSSQLLVDLVIVAIAFLGWALTEARRLGIMRWWLLSAGLTFAVGICCAVPLFLLVRDLYMDQHRRTDAGVTRP